MEDYAYAAKRLSSLCATSTNYIGCGAVHTNLQVNGKNNEFLGVRDADNLKGNFEDVYFPLGCFGVVDNARLEQAKLCIFGPRNSRDEVR